MCSGDCGGSGKFVGHKSYAPKRSSTRSTGVGASKPAPKHFKSGSNNFGKPKIKMSFGRKY